MSSITCPECGGRMFLKSFQSPKGISRFWACDDCGTKQKEKGSLITWVDST